MQQARHAIFLGAMALCACAGNGEGLDQNGQPLGSGNSSSGQLLPTFQSIQANVFDVYCIGCHSGATAPQGLQLDAGHSFSLLVGVPSAEVSSVLRVQAGNPDNSYLVRKLQGSAGIVGGRMPLGGPYLSSDMINTIRQWVVDGAQQASGGVRVQSAIQFFSLTTAAPADLSSVDAPIVQIVLGFSAELDASSVNDTTLWLERTESRIEPALGVPVAITVRLPVALSLASGNPATVILRPKSPLPAGAYRVVVRGTGGGALADIGGAILGVDQNIDFVAVEPDSATKSF